jgi:hypothetical protein
MSNSRHDKGVQPHINITGDGGNLSAQQKLAIAISFLNKLEVEIKGNIVEFEGNRAFLTIFTPNNFINL